LGTALLVLAPVAAYGVWRWLYGAQFDFVELSYFGRGPFQQGWLDSWHEAYDVLTMGKAYHPLVSPDCWQFVGGVKLENRLYYLFEFLATGLGLLACALTFRKYPGPALFGLAVLVISFTSGGNCVAQGMPRYVLAVPSIFILLAQWGRNTVFDRAWTLTSALLLGLLTLLFTFNFWVG
jgi:hypothetical protein